MNLKDSFLSLAGVYIITNLTNGKCYVGESLNIKKRMRDYRCSKRTTSQPVIHAIRKYGVENFHIEIFYLPGFKKEDLLDLEEAAIKTFKSLIPNGYNVCRRGSNRKYATGFKLSEESRKKLSLSKMGNPSRKGQRNSDEVNRQCSERMKGNKIWLGKKHSEETRKKMSELCKGKIPSQRKKIKTNPNDPPSSFLS